MQWPPGGGNQKEMIMDAELPTYDDQARLWNGRAGQAWIAQQPLLDRLFEPMQDLLTAEVVERRGRQVLDVGCGPGTTTLAVARRLAPGGRCVGIDISAPMIEFARERAANDGAPVSFICADAQTYAFEAASFDTIMSRFGVMFFGDSVAAFANLRRAAREDAALRFIAWRSPEENPFMTTAQRAAAPLLSYVPARRPDAPGQFAFADRGRVSRILEASGWADIDVRAIDIPCTFPEPDLLSYITRLGPVGLVLQDADEQLRAKVIQTIRPAFEPFVHGGDVRFTAACWMVSARAPSASGSSVET